MDGLHREKGTKFHHGVAFFNNTPIQVASLNIASMSDANIEDLVEKTGCMLHDD
jgi:hypothetical protein